MDILLDDQVTGLGERLGFHRCRWKRHDPDKRRVP